MAFDRLEPIGGRRLDYNTAYVVQTLWNIFRGKDDPQAPDLATIALRFGPDTEDQPVASLESKVDFMMEAAIAAAAAPTRQVVSKPRGG